jgi:hypothetical protein
MNRLLSRLQFARSCYLCARDLGGRGRLVSALLALRALVSGSTGRYRIKNREFMRSGVR